ncbi:hypothetical protein I308_106024 [Cryptococcus tetragattii IND107]|uniref:Uncharacterized protein n=1 Tax=Cryptococcus tetragattii IND107 TaxID=1296105 RepID=A0ABR3BJG1_9TREE
MTVDRRSIAVGTPADSKYPSLESIYSSISSIPRRFSACALYCSISLPSVLEGSTELLPIWFLKFAFSKLLILSWLKAGWWSVGSFPVEQMPAENEFACDD